MPDESLPLATLRLHVEQTIKHLERCKPWAYLDLQLTEAVLRRVLAMAERCQAVEAERDRLRKAGRNLADVLCEVVLGNPNVTSAERNQAVTKAFDEWHEAYHAAGPQGVQG